MRLTLVLRTMSLDDMKRELRERYKLAKLIKEIIGKSMTKEQEKFLNELRKKVKAKEMTVEQARKEWNRKYKVWRSDNPISTDEIEEALDVLEQRRAWLEENRPEAKREIEDVRSCIISLLVWIEDLKKY